MSTTPLKKASIHFANNICVCACFWSKQKNIITTENTEDTEKKEASKSISVLSVISVVDLVMDCTNSVFCSVKHGFQ